MYKSTFQQIILFILTSVIIYKAGQYLVALNGIKSFTDFFIIMAFFVSTVLFLNCFARLGSKLVSSLSF